MDWKPILYRYSLRIAGNRWDAEDLAQESWIKLMDALAKRPDRPVTNAFLYRLVKNVWLDALRKRRLETVPWEEAAESGITDPSLSSRELLEQLAERLPPKMAVILLLMDIFDFTARETASFVRMKEAAVQVTLGRARTKLKQWAREPQGPGRRRKTDEAAGGSSVDMDGLVGAFRRQDPEAIFRAYLGLAREGIQLARLEAQGAGLQFTFRDPDGNVFRIISHMG